MNDEDVSRNIQARVNAGSRRRLHGAAGSYWWVILFALIGEMAAGAASLPAEWQRDQQFSVSEAGLIKLSLPAETLDSARPALEDLRVYDASGNEAPYMLERPAVATKATLSAKSFEVALQPSATVITFETGLTQSLDGVTLESPASSFIKAVKVESSTNKRNWQPLADALPIFRQANAVNQLRLTLPEGTWRFLRLTVDDRRSSPVPFTGARVHAAAAEPTPTEPLPVLIADRIENPGETRLTLKLPAANLHVANIQIDTREPLFTRAVTVAAPQITEDTIGERPLAQGAFYRVAVEGQPPSANLSIAVEAQVRSRDLVLHVENHDSPPLAITSIRAERRPIYLIFLARESGTHHLLTGNSQCAAPRYDLAALGANLKNARLVSVDSMPIGSNPSYRAPEALPGIQDTGTALDVAAWTFRKSIELGDATAQQVELDLDVLEHAQPAFQDLRLVREGKQVPYIVERTSISRSLTPTVTLANDPKKPKQSRWMIKLSHRGLPVTRLVCESRTPLFRRQVVLYEEVADDRGEKRRRILNETWWTRTPGHAKEQFVMQVREPLLGDTLFLETDNGDNTPIELDQFRVAYPVTRILFKASPADRVFLYYGHARAIAPRYDLSLVAAQLMAANKESATLGTEQQLKKPSWREGQTPGKGGPIFWAILGLVVVVLLLIISRLLPQPAKVSGTPEGGTPNQTPEK